MNHTSILILTAFLLFTIAACSGSDDGNGQVNQDAVTGFRESKWGMTQDEVKQTETSTPLTQSDQLVLYRVNHLDLPSMAGYIFEDGKLIKGAYLFEESYDNPDDYIANYERLKSELISKYGPPALDEIKWTNDEGRDLQEADGESVCKGDVIYQSEWVKQDTIIRLLLNSDSTRCRQGIIYESKYSYIQELPESAQSPTSSDQAE